MKLSILISVYNEENTINKILDNVESVDIGWAQKEIIVVDDGSDDGTRDTLRERARKKKDIIFIEHPKNMGKGAAIGTAITHAAGDIIII